MTAEECPVFAVGDRVRYTMKNYPALEDCEVFPIGKVGTVIVVEDVPPYNYHSVGAQHWYYVRGFGKGHEGRISGALLEKLEGVE